MINDTIVEVRGLCKNFKKIRALDNVNLDIARGSIIGLVGANGAGKSTLLRHIMGLYVADEGQCSTFGVESTKIGAGELSRIGYVHQEGELLNWMTVGQLIRYVSAYYETWDRELEELYIKDFDINLKDRVGGLSPGQRQKVAILLAVGFNPELLILDEPASGLDPIARGQFLDLLLEIIQQENRTIIISSHILSDIEKVIDHTVIMDKGAIVRDCGFDALREEFLRFSLESLNGPLPAELGFQNVIQCQRDDKRALITVSKVGVDQIQNRARALNCDIQVKPMSLDEIYKIIITN
jgi:ABC-2 type transport system ATP-binding protein